MRSVLRTLGRTARSILSSFRPHRSRWVHPSWVQAGYKLGSQGGYTQATARAGAHTLCCMLLGALRTQRCPISNHTEAVRKGEFP
eukprot:1160513-Pelagomonas_calceolata.AAC.2